MWTIRINDPVVDGAARSYTTCDVIVISWDLEFRVSTQQLQQDLRVRELRMSVIKGRENRRIGTEIGVDTLKKEERER